MASVNEAFWQVCLSEIVPSSTIVRNHSTNFPGLPIEIRLRIVQRTFMGGNVVIDTESVSNLKRVSLTPIALRLNRESRIEATKRYKLLGHCGKLLFK